ncbi:50S ribosomal protein L3 [Spiroplasma endosymbiont of Crioceris asparagi]|uniref:50S ribosomal protein L3 n=1 Tax=Spiroplasma endosymbiont of Crioceris asparagi TaxID=3066286 RepID=UPI0030D4E9D1
MKGILGQKLEMSQVFDENGKLIPVTIVLVEPNKVLEVKTTDKHGYKSLKLGTNDKRENLVNKPELGQFKKVNSQPKRFVKEIRDMEGFAIGQDIKVADLFQAGDIIDVTGVSKGKGFAGAIKRHNYSRGPMAHGSGYHRGIGSMGAIINRIFKSKKMAGHMGHEKVTVQNLEIVKIISDKNIVLIKGSVPGPKKGFLIIKENHKCKNKKAASVLIERKKASSTKNEQPHQQAEEKASQE